MVAAAEPPDELERLIGSTVAGKYRVERLLGRGGMGAVFQATHAAIGKRVALKFLNVRAARDGDAALRFQREAEAASLAESPHIVHIFDSGRSEQGLPFLVMELLVGEDLRARLQREGRLEEPAALRIAIQIVRALRKAHAAGIVHRDLKPDNVFLCHRDDEPAFVKLVDFGISKLQRSLGVDTLTHQGAVLGTAFYMSPEQAQSFPDIDGRTDLFSVGALLYEMLAGEPPHRGPTYEAVLIAICTQDAEDVRRRAPATSRKLAAIVGRALARDRHERYQTAEELLSDLEAVERESRALAPAPRRAGPPVTTAASRFAGLVVGVVAALGGFALAAWLVARERNDSAQAATAPHGAAETEIRATERAPEPLRATPAEAPSQPAVVMRAPSASARAAASPATKPSAKTSRPAASASARITAPGATRGLTLSTREP